MNIPYVMRKCTKCGRWLVANKINFSRAKNGRYGLNSKCKECNKQYYETKKERIAERDKRYREVNKERLAERRKQYYQANKEKEAENMKRYREANKEKMAEYYKQYREVNREKIAEQRKQYYEANRDKELERNKQYYEDNKEKILEQCKQYREQYYENNKEKIAERHKQWYQTNREKELERSRQYYENNKEKIAEYQKQYKQTPQGQAVLFNARNKRRHKKEAQGTGATGEQWIEMMQYFDWRCAYTGKRLTKKTRSTDHIVPIDAGGDDMVWNMVPMLRNLNSSKCAKDMLEWYKQQSFFSEARLAKIYDWQEYAYNKWGKDAEYFNTNDIQITLL